jgi:hypothetical protein
MAIELSLQVEENYERRRLLEKIEILKRVMTESADPQLNGLLQAILDRYLIELTAACPRGTPEC